MRKLFLGTAVAITGFCAVNLQATELDLSGANQPTAASLAVNSPTEQNQVYIVRLAESPVAAYDGDINGLKATRPKKW
jgi:hypothetical protein